MKRNTRAGAIGILIASALLLNSCSDIREANNIQPDITSIPAIKPITVIAESTATPEPEIVIREPVKSRSPMRIKTDVDRNVTVPAFYQPIDIEGVNYCVYAYTSTDGTTKYRVYAEVDELEDENVMNTLKGFFDARITVNAKGIYVVETRKEDDPITEADEDPAILKTCQVPTRNNKRAYIRDAEKAATKYEKDLINAEKKGEPKPEPTPWDGLPIITDETVEVIIPRQVKTYKRIENLYYYVNVCGDNEYRRYATPNGNESGFYLSDEEGNISAGALMVNYELDFAKENFRSGKKRERPSDNTYRLPVVIRLTDGNTATVYSVYSRIYEE